MRHQLLIIEDDAYGDLRFDGDEVPALAALARTPAPRTALVYLATLSKIVAPGLRTGWMVAPPEIVQRCVIAKQTIDLSTSPWIQGAATHYLKSGLLERHLPRIRAAYREQAHAMVGALRERLAGKITFSAPQGGMFVWGLLPAGVDASVLVRTAIEEKVMYVPGAPFYADAPDPRSLRLCFSMSTPSASALGVERLERAFSRYDSDSLEEDNDDQVRRQWQGSLFRAARRHAAALGAARRARADRHQVRLRRGAMRRLHRARRRAARRARASPRSPRWRERRSPRSRGSRPSGDHPLQKAWIAEQVPQCGYCQSGQIMQAAALLAKNKKPTREQIVTHMNGNLCRCGTYGRIISAIERAAREG